MGGWRSAFTLAKRPCSLCFQVVDSTLQLRIDLGSDDRILALPHVNVSDGLWHTARMRRWGNQAALQLDNGDGRSVTLAPIPPSPVKTTLACYSPANASGKSTTIDVNFSGWALGAENGFLLLDRSKNGRQQRGRRDKLLGADLAQLPLSHLLEERRVKPYGLFASVPEPRVQTPAYSST